jgi:hypothetical protein
MVRAIATDYEGSEALTFLPRAFGHEWSLMAVFPNPRAARAACEALRAAGIEDRYVVFLGCVGDEVSTKYGLSTDERLMLRSFTWRVVLDSAVGAVAGGALNLLLALVFIDGGSGRWAAAAGGVVFGALVGALVGGVGAVMRSSSQRELHRRHPELDHTIVGLETDTPADVERAEAVLRGLNPLQITHSPLPGTVV